MTTAPYHWIQNLERTITQMGGVPLAEEIPSFPWETFQELLSKKFESGQIRLTCHPGGLQSPEKLPLGLGAHPFVLCIEASPLSGAVYWLLPAEDLRKFTALFLSSAPSAESFSLKEFQEGFYCFLALEALEGLESLHAFQGLSLRILPEGSLPDEYAFCFDIGLEMKGHTFWGKLVVPETFHMALKTHFSANRPSLLSSPMAREVQIALHATVGQTTLPETSWEKIRPGDFLLLDKCTLDPLTQRGSAVLQLEKTPLFQTKIEEDGLKILDYTSEYEELAENEELEEVFELEEEIELPIEKEEGQIPSVTVMVGAAELSMSLEKLLELKPESLLELPAGLEPSVHLMMQGKRVATGELLKMGDLLGVRILTLHG